MRKFIIGIVLISLLNSFTFAQKGVDTTTFYLKAHNNECYKAVEMCVTALKKFEAENKLSSSVLTIHSSYIDSDEIHLTINYFGNLLSRESEIPDYYSYIQGVPIFWYTGKSFIAPINDGYKQFILGRFSKYFLRSVEEQEKWLKSISSAPKTITNEEFEKLTPAIIESSETRYFFIPTYIIKIKNNKVDIDRLEKSIYGR